MKKSLQEVISDLGDAIYVGESLGYSEETVHVMRLAKYALMGEQNAAEGQRCESGWTHDRCTLPLFHGGHHSND